MKPTDYISAKHTFFRVYPNPIKLFLNLHN